MMDLENYYISGLPIKCKDLGTIYQLTIREMFEIGVTHNELVVPFIALEKVFIESDFYSKFQVLKELHTLSELLKQANSDSLDIYGSIIESLKLLYKTNDISYVQMENIEGILVECKDYKCAITINNFDSLCNIIFEMFGIDKQNLFKDDGEVWKENTGSDREKKMIEYFKNKNKKKKEKETLNLCDYINIVTNLGNYTYDEVLSMTYYQLISSFKTLVTLQKYNEELGYRWSFKFNIEDKQKNWITEVKLSNSAVKL